MIVYKSAPFVDTVAPETPGKIVLYGSNIAEDATYPEWDNATNYTAGDIVKIATEHKLYESVTGGVNKNPLTTLGVDWIEYSATNLWRAFDQKVNAQTVADADDLQFTFKLRTLVTAIALFNLSGKSVTVRVYSPDQYAAYLLDPMDDNPSFSHTRVLVDQTALIDWFEYFFAETTAQTELVVLGLPGYTGYYIVVDVEGSSAPAAVGEIAMGKHTEIGRTHLGGRVTEQSFSTVDEDVFGNLTIVPRDAVNLIDFPLSWYATDTGRVKKVMAELRDVPSVYLALEDCAVSGAIGMLSYGFYREFDVSIVSRNVVFGNISIRTLI